jgi:hypothetical protein
MTARGRIDYRSAAGVGGNYPSRSARRPGRLSQAGYDAAASRREGPAMNESRVLVVGATGQLGGLIACKLIASGTQVPQGA